MADQINQNNDIPKLEVHASAQKPNIAKDVGKYMLDEYIAPAATDMFHDMLSKIGSSLNEAFQGGLNKIFYHQDTGRKVGGTGTNTGRTSYQTFYSRQSSGSSYGYNPSNDISRRSSTEVQIITVDTEDDAKRLVGMLQDLIRKYKVAKVSDLYGSLTPKVPIAFTDYKYGWTNPNEIGYQPVWSGPNRGKFQLDLPQPIDITNVQ